MRKRFLSISENIIQDFYSVFNNITELTTNVFKKDWEMTILENAPFVDVDSFGLLKKFLIETQENNILVFPVQPSINDNYIHISGLSEYKKFKSVVNSKDFQIFGGYIIGESLTWGCFIEVDNSFLYVGTDKKHKEALSKTFLKSNYLVEKEFVEGQHEQHKSFLYNAPK